MIRLCSEYISRLINDIHVYLQTAREKIEHSLQIPNECLHNAYYIQSGGNTTPATIRKVI